MATAGCERTDALNDTLLLSAISRVELESGVYREAEPSSELDEVAWICCSLQFQFYRSTMTPRPLTARSLAL